MLYDGILELTEDEEDYKEAMQLGLDLDDLNDYEYFRSLKY